MNILIPDAYFFPEVISFSHLENDLLDGLVTRGDKITVICPTPTRGISDNVYEKYKKVKREKIKGVDVIRFPSPREGKSILARAFRYFWCNLREYQIGRRMKGTEVIFAVSTPPTQGLLAGLLAKKLKCRFVYSLQDVFPDSLVTTGIAKRDGLLWKLGRKIEDKTYSLASEIIVISDAIKQNIVNKGVDEGKIKVIPNWTDCESVWPIEKSENKLIGELAIPKYDFTVVYAGNLGYAQSVDTVLKSAEILQKHKNIGFVFIGNGALEETVKKEISEKELNAVWYPFQKQDRVAEVYSIGDVCIISCKNGSGKAAMPSKTWSIMACNTPIIASFDTDSELAELLEKSHSGICVPPEDGEALAEAIIGAAEGRVKISKNGREYVLKNASKTVNVKKYLEII